jgi:hypothetical protein
LVEGETHINRNCFIFEQLFILVLYFREHQDRDKADHEDIINKLSNCVTEQSKRAQKVEVKIIIYILSF